MNSEELLAFRAYVDAKAKCMSINCYLYGKHNFNILGEDPEIQVDTDTFHDLARAYNATPNRTPITNEDLAYAARLSFDIPSKEYAIVITVFCCAERRGDKNV